MKTYTLSFVDSIYTHINFAPKWWDRPRWALVRWLGGECPYDTVKVARFVIDGETFADRLFKQKRALFDRFGREPQTLLIGGEDYRDLMNSPDVRHAFSFSSQFNYDRQVYGLTVRVIPWMRGVVVMPRGEDL